MPTGAAAAEMRAPSPPELPPTMHAWSYALRVVPCSFVALSYHMHSSETVEETKGMRPASFMRRIDGASAVATKALPRAMASGSWFGSRKPTAREVVDAAPSESATRPESR